MRKLNIGPGPRWTKPGWKTLDFYREDADILCDLRESPRLPIPSHSLRKIFCSHVIEHLKEEAVINLLSESHRTLQYGGIARFSCPDLEKAVAQFWGGQCDPFGEVISKSMEGAASHFRLLNVVASFRAPEYQGIVNTRLNEYSGGPRAELREVKRRLKDHDLQRFADWAHSLIPGNASYVAHINAFWASKLQTCFHKAGFEDVRVSRYRESVNKELRGLEFDSRPHISLFVEGRAHGAAKFISLRSRRAQRSLRAGFRRARKLRP